jgi:hypothetical protein
LTATDHFESEKANLKGGKKLRESARKNRGMCFLDLLRALFVPGSLRVFLPDGVVKD